MTKVTFPLPPKTHSLADSLTALPKERYIVHQPTLMVNSDNFISASADFPAQMKPFVDDLNMENLHTGHWIMLEKPKETNELLEKFFKG